MLDSAKLGNDNMVQNDLLGSPISERYLDLQQEATPFVI